MKVPLALLADFANTTKEGKLNILGEFDTLYAASFPAVHPQMVVVLRFEADIAEAGQTKQIGLTLMDDDGKKLFQMDGSLKLSEIRPGVPARTNSILTLNQVSFPKPGSYQFTVFVNGEPKNEISLRVLPLEPHRETK